VSIPLLIGSILGVFGLAALAYWLGLGGGALGDQAEARRLAEEALPGFEGGEAFVSTDGRSALVLGRTGGAALLKVHGTHPAARRLEPPLRILPLDDGVHVASGELMFGAVTLHLPPDERDRLLTMV
jgi:hypothetical protein